MDAAQGRPDTHLGRSLILMALANTASSSAPLRFFFCGERHLGDPTRDLIVQTRYLTFGCSSAIVSSEALCALLKEQRKTSIEALHISHQDLTDCLDGLPPGKNETA
jgi:hypothetical protein